MNIPFLFGAQVVDIDNKGLTMAVTKLTFYSPNWCDVTCTYWLEGKLETVTLPDWRLISAKAATKHNDEIPF